MIADCPVRARGADERMNVQCKTTATTPTRNWAHSPNPLRDIRLDVQRKEEARLPPLPQASHLMAPYRR